MCLFKKLKNKRKSKQTEQIAEKGLNNYQKDKKAIFIGILLVCFLFIGIMITVNIYILRIANDKPKMVQAIYSATFFTDGLTLIGLAISVWAGLNIANAVERKELDNNKRDIDRLKATTTEITKDISPILKNVENISNTLWFLFENELLRTRDDAASLFLYDTFTEKAKDKNTLLISILPDLIVIEQLFNQVYSLHDSKQELNIEINERGKRGLDIINECLESIVDNSDKDIVNYLKYRKAELCFYLGYTTKDLGYVYDYYKTAGDLYIELHESFNALLPEYNEKFFKDNNIDKYIPVFSKDNENDLRLSIYFANSICEAYSRIILSVNEKSFKNKEIQYTKDGKEIKDLEEITKKAIFYGCCSTKWAKGKVYNEVYFRNLGCAYERYERLFGSLGDYHTEIINNYKKAFELIVDHKVLPYRIQSVYYTLIQYLRRYLEDKLTINIVFMDENPRESMDALKTAISKKDRLTSDDAKYLKLLYDVSSFAQKDIPRHRLQFSVNGLSLSVIAYYKLKNDSIIEQVCNYSVIECIEKMEKNISVIEVMGEIENDNYSKWLINRKNTLKSYYYQYVAIEKRGNDE